MDINPISSQSSNSAQSGVVAAETAQKTNGVNAQQIAPARESAENGSDVKKQQDNEDARVRKFKQAADTFYYPAGDVRVTVIREKNGNLGAIFTNIRTGERFTASEGEVLANAGLKAIDQSI